MIPAVLRQLQARYQVETASDDPVVRRVAEQQLERLLAGRRRARRATRHSTSSSTDAGRDEAQPTRWAYALEQLLTDAGNPPQRWRGDGTYDCGHEPRHSSTSGRCLWVHPTEGRWWCRACGESGDALTWVMRQQGYTFPAAYAWLLLHVGPPYPPPSSTP